MTPTLRALHFFRKSPSSWFVCSAIPVLILLVTALSLSPQSFRTSKNTIRVYCASAAAVPVRQFVKRFNQSNVAQKANVDAVLVRIGGSGELAGQILAERATSIESGCDIFVSADSLHTSAIFENCLASKAHAVASQHPVIAVAKSQSADIGDFSSLGSLLDSPELSFAIGSNSTAIGSITRGIAERQGLLNKLESRKSTDCENVMMIAQALATGSVDAAIIWDSTVSQFNSLNSNKLRTASYLDPEKKLDGLIVIVQIQSTNSSADIFIAYLQENHKTIDSLFSGSGFSSPASKFLESID